MPRIAARIVVTLYGAPSGVCVMPIERNDARKLAAASFLFVRATHLLASLYNPSSLLIQSETFQWFQFLCPLYLAMFSLLLFFGTFVPKSVITFYFCFLRFLPQNGSIANP
jgi:hypothetical protein